MAKRKSLPKGKWMGELGKDCLGGKAITGTITWTREQPGLYHSDPFRFVLTKVEETKYNYEHWRVQDCRVVASYFGKTAKECKQKAQDVIDIEQGRKKKPKPKPRKKQKPYRYEGFFRDGKRVYPDGFRECKKCEGTGKEGTLRCSACNETGMVDGKAPPTQRKGLFG